MPTFHEWQWRPTGAYFFAMLVSAAIEPYKKSNGNSRNSSATATGRTASERITASPRKTCVAGVHAWARDGETAIMRTINAAKRRTFRDACAGTGTLLDAKALPLSTNRAPKIFQFGLDGVIDCFASP